MFDSIVPSPAHRGVRRAVAGLSALLVASMLAVVPAAAPVIRAATATMLVAPSSTITYGATAHVAVTITTGDAAVTDGTLTISEHGTQLDTCSVTDGSCHFAVRDLTAGTHTFALAYAGTADFDASSATTTVTVDKAPTVLHLATAPASPLFGGSVAVTASVSTGDGHPVTAGTIRVVVAGTGGATQSCSVTSGTCVLHFSGLGGGGHAVTADYTGGIAPDFDASSATTTVTVDKAPTHLTLTATPSSGTVATVYTFHVSVSSGDSPVSSGTVTFSDGSRTLSSCAISAGSCSITSGDLTTGAGTIVAHYGGTADYEATSGSTTITVTKIPTVLAITATPATGLVGALVTIRVSVSTGDGGAVRTGAVAITDGATTLAAACSITTGTCILATREITAGTRTILASFAGSATYEATSGSATVSLKRSQTITFTRPGVDGYLLGGSGVAPFTLSVRASSGLAVDVTSATPATCSVSGLAVTGIASGTCRLIARQGGNAEWSAATAATVSVTVIKTKFRIGYTVTYVVGGQVRLSVPLIVKKGTLVTMRFRTALAGLAGQKVEVYRTLPGGRPVKLVAKTISSGLTASYTFSATYGAAYYRWRFPGSYLYHDEWLPSRQVLAV